MEHRYVSPEVIGSGQFVFVQNSLKNALYLRPKCHSLFKALEVDFKVILIVSVMWLVV